MRNRFLRTEGFRLSALYAGVFALSFVILAGFVLVATNQALRDQILAYSATDIAAIRDGYAHEGVHEAREVINQLMAAPASSGFYLLQQDGRPVAGNLPAMTPQTGTADIAFTTGNHTHRVLGTGALLAPGLYVFSGGDTRRLRTVQRHILNVMLVLFAAALLLAVVSGALVSRSFLRRTDAMAKACRDIMQGNFSMRIPVRGADDELDRLAEAINDMLARIAALMENLAQVSNDIAHDLRTPVTHLRHRLERALADSKSLDDHRGALEAAIAKADEILGLFSALLRIAQIEGGARRAAFASIDLAALLAQMRELFEPVADEAGHVLELTAPGPAVIRGDRQLLAQLFSNLIENAIVHTPRGTHIRLSLSQGDGRVVARVSDDGPGVPRDEHEKLFRRLYRREASRTQPGHGLGLSLAAAIAELHGAGISVAADGKPGLAVEISFPMPADSPQAA
ncbi:MAG TPA: ATP-binding protein [Rhizomicrobium sp.]|nr:ATP-binding protein [Rhizomicrobium sp.]